MGKDFSHQTDSNQAGKAANQNAQKVENSG